MPKISFISANYVARALNYRGPSDWMAHDAATIKTASPEHFAGIAADVAAAGFENIDIWTAHCHWQHHGGGDYIEIVKGICSQYDLTITSYAGGLHPSSAADLEAPFKFMKQLGAKPQQRGEIYEKSRGKGSLMIEWPSGLREEKTGVAMNRVVAFTEPRP